MHVHGTGNVAELVGEPFADQIISALVHAGHLHINGCGSSEIQNLRDDIGRLEEKLHAGETLGEFLAQVVDVHAGRLAADFFQLNQDFRVGAPNRARVAVGKIYAAVGQADVVEDRGQFFFWNGFADDTIDLVGDSSGFFNTQTRASPHMQTDLTGVHFGKKIAAENADEQKGETAKRKKTCREEPGRMERSAQSPSIPLAESFKALFKALLIAPEEAHLLPDVFFGVIFVFRTQEIHSQRRNDGPRPHVGSQHGKAHRFRERDKQKPGNAGQEKHWDENNTNAERGDKRGHGDLLGAIQDRLNGFLAHGQVAVDVFNLDGSVIHQNADGESETAKRHDVDGLAERAEAQNADKNRQWDRDGNDQSALPIPEEEQDHDRREAGSDDRLADNALDGGADIQRLVEEGGDMQPFRK